MADWFFQLGGSVLGPITAQRLAEMASDGRLANGDLVRRSDQAAWVQAEQLQGLKFAAAPSSPPTVTTSSSEPPKSPPRARLPVELKSIVSATLSHAARIPDWLLLRYGLWRNRREIRSAQIEFGRELFEAGAGSPQVRETLQALFAELATADAKQVSALNRRRDELFAGLGGSSRDAGAHASPTVDRLARLSKGESEIRARINLIRRQLLPTDSADRGRIALGYAALGLLSVLMVFAFGTGDRERERSAAPATSETVAALSQSPKPVSGSTEPSKIPNSVPQGPLQDVVRQHVTRLHNNGSSVPIFDFAPGTMFKNGTDMKIIFTVPDGTACLEDKAYIGVENDFKQGMAKIEILEGDYRGKRGWTLRQAMQTH